MNQAFEYRAFQFTLSVEQTGADLYLPKVRYEASPLGTGPADLPPDADPYGSEQEAWRHAEQQAIRWVNDRTGDGRGQF